MNEAKAYLKRCTACVLTTRVTIYRSCSVSVSLIVCAAVALVYMRVHKAFHNKNPYNDWEHDINHPKAVSIERIAHYTKTFRNIHSSLNASQHCSGDVMGDLRRLRHLVAQTPKLQKLNETIHVIWKANPRFQTKHVTKQTIEDLLYVQTCQYRNLDFFQYNLAPSVGITDYSALAGSLIGVRCHNSMVIWDDDIDVFLEDCNKLYTFFNSLDPEPPTVAWDWRFKGRKINNDWDLFLTKHDHVFSVFKLRPRNRPMPRPTKDLGGIDIECKNHWFLAYLLGFGRSGNLLSGHTTIVHEFGPTSIRAPTMATILHIIEQKYPLPRHWEQGMDSVMDGHCPKQF